MRSLSTLLLASLLLWGCATGIVQPRGGDLVAIKSEFDAQSLGLVFQKGEHLVNGQAFLTTRAGDPKTCAGNEVVLLAATPYSAERMRLIYGNDQSGYFPITGRGVQFVNDHPDYVNYRRTVVCDAAGDFVFRNVHEGEYFVIAKVIWQTPIPSTEGGFLMRRIRVDELHDGDRIIVTRR